MHPPHRPKRNESGEKSVSSLVKTFFFFFLETTWIWAKNHSQFWWRHPNFWGFVLQIPPTKIFWIRHCAPSWYSEYSLVKIWYWFLVLFGISVMILIVLISLWVAERLGYLSFPANKTYSRGKTTKKVRSVFTLQVTHYFFENLMKF